MKNKILILGAILFFIPFSAFAEKTHHYACSDFDATNLSPFVCSSGIITIPNTTSVYILDSLPVFNLSAGEWYLTVKTFSGTGQMRWGSGGVGAPFSDSFTSTISDQLFTVGTAGGLEVTNYTGVPSNFTGNVGGFCVTDTIGGCIETPPPPPPSSGFEESIIASQGIFYSTTGFDIGEVASSTGNNLIKLFIGSGLALLYELRGWIVALVIIGSIIFFAGRAFRFFRH